MAEPGDWLAAAAAIARHLSATAYAHDGRCNWMGTTQSADADTGDIEFTYGTLGPDLYGGTSGVALFLAEAAARTGDRELREVAAGGMTHALSRAASIPRELGLGFYSGTVGVAYAAARVGRALGEQEFADGARAILSELHVDDGVALAMDVLSGAAGAAPTLLVLGDWLGQPQLRELALKLGDRLLGAATRDTARGWSWADPDGDDETPHLTGFSHGAGGIGWSLLKLYDATGEARYLEGAEQAFAYEDSWFRPEADNWPDFREAVDAGDPVPCGVAWCHGAPGIGLGRAQALRSTSGATHRAAVAAALRTCVAALEAVGADADADGSLCHGRAGLCEITVALADVPGDDKARTAALDAAAFASARYAATPAEWPCGVARGSNPSLMLGLAGIGYSYLRLADPALASVLEPGG